MLITGYSSIRRTPYIDEVDASHANQTNLNTIPYSKSNPRKKLEPHKPHTILSSCWGLLRERLSWFAFEKVEKPIFVEPDCVHQDNVAALHIVVDCIPSLLLTPSSIGYGQTVGLQLPVSILPSVLSSCTSHAPSSHEPLSAVESERAG
jgi:hypothetical protein